MTLEHFFEIYEDEINEIFAAEEITSANINKIKVALEACFGSGILPISVEDLFSVISRLASAMNSRDVKKDKRVPFSEADAVEAGYSQISFYVEEDENRQINANIENWYEIHGKQRKRR